MIFKSRRCRLIALTLCLAYIPALHADLVTVSGTITQSTQDGTGPAVNNPKLNDIPDGASYRIDLNFPGYINTPGTYNLTGANLVFSVAGMTEESNFDFLSLTVTRSGSFEQIGLLACLTTGSGCNQGNALSLSFMIPAADLNSDNITGQEIPGLLPLDLLEDDGATDIHGLITGYSYSPPGSVPTDPVPEPAAVLLFGSSVAVMVANRLRDRSRSCMR